MELVADKPELEQKRTHESGKRRGLGGSQLGRDQNKNKADESRERRGWWVPVQPGPKQNERAHESVQKRSWGGSQFSRDKNKKKELMRAEKEGLGGYQIIRDQNKKKKLLE